MFGRIRRNLRHLKSQTLQLALRFEAGRQGLHGGIAQVARRIGLGDGWPQDRDTPVSLRGVDPFSQANIENPYPYYAALREHAPVFRVPKTDYWVISRHEDIRRVVVDTEHFSSNLVAILMAQSGGRTAMFKLPDIDVGPVDVLAIQDAPEHARQRRLARSALKPSLVRKLEGNLNVLAHGLVDRFLDLGEVDWITAFAEELPLSVTLDLCGFPRRERRRVKRGVDHAIDLLSGVNTARSFAAHVEGGMDLYRFVCEQFEATKRSVGENLASTLLHATRVPTAQGELLSEEEAISMLLQVLIAGSDSTASLLGSAMRRLLEDDELQRRLRAEPALIAAFLEEMLRLESPFQGHFRQVRADCLVAGTRLREGDRVMVLWASGNRDPTAFADPELINLERDNSKSHLSFGHGSHFCLGAALARLETRVGLETMLKRTGWIQRGAGPVRHARSVFVRTLATLPIAFVPAGHVGLGSEHV